MRLNEDGIKPPVFVLDEHFRDLGVAERLAGSIRQQILLGNIRDVFRIRILGEQMIKRLVFVRA